MNCYAFLPSPVGRILLCAGDDGLSSVSIEGQRGYKDVPCSEEYQGCDAILQATDWLRRYFAGERPEPASLCLAPARTEFGALVRNLLLSVPYGETVTYGELAKKIARITGKVKMSPQAVGGAVGHNNISIIVPCHRVVGTGGNLTGYDGGLTIKRKLLSLEGVPLSGFHMPLSGRFA